MSRMATPSPASRPWRSRTSSRRPTPSSTAVRKRSVTSPLPPPTSAPSASRSTRAKAPSEPWSTTRQNFLLRGYFKKRGYESSADLAKNEIPSLPENQPLKTFTYDPKHPFDKIDTAKLKNQNSLRDAGQFLAANEFGIAVVVVYTGMTGEAQKDLVLTQARAAIIRAYLIDNFGFDDTPSSRL